MTRSTCLIHLLLISLLAAGCQALAPSGGYYDSPLQTGAEITVTRELLVPADYARVYLQNGNTESYASMNQYEPFCYFLMDQPMPVVQKIHPGVFRVKKVSLIETQVRRSLPVRLVAFGLFADDGGRSLIAFQSYMTLTAQHQDNVRALVCSGAFDTPPEARPIRLPELQRALGESIRVRATPAPGAFP